MKVKAKKEEKRKKKPTTQIGKFWQWLWHSDSLLSWLVALALAIVIVKFVIFPSLSLMLGTSLPLVVVESSSMEHPQASFLRNYFLTQSSFNLWWQEKGSWYEDKGIEKEEASKWPLKTGFDKGDIMVVYGRFKPEIGDVIIFEGNAKYPIIHRVIDTNNETLATKGDNNAAQLPGEKNIGRDGVIGKAVFRIPKIGWIKLIAVEIWNALFS